MAKAPQKNPNLDPKRFDLNSKKEKKVEPTQHKNNPSTQKQIKSVERKREEEDDENEFMKSEEDEELKKFEELEKYVEEHPSFRSSISFVEQIFNSNKTSYTNNNNNNNNYVNTSSNSTRPKSIQMRPKADAIEEEGSDYENDELESDLEDHLETQLNAFKSRSIAAAAATSNDHLLLEKLLQEVNMGPKSEDKQLDICNARLSSLLREYESYRPENCQPVSGAGTTSVAAVATNVSRSFELEQEKRLLALKRPSQISRKVKQIARCEQLLSSSSSEDEEERLAEDERVCSYSNNVGNESEKSSKRVPAQSGGLYFDDDAAWMDQIEKKKKNKSDKMMSKRSNFEFEESECFEEQYLRRTEVKNEGQSSTSDNNQQQQQVSGLISKLFPSIRPQEKQVSQNLIQIKKSYHFYSRIYIIFGFSYIFVNLEKKIHCF